MSDKQMKQQFLMTACALAASIAIGDLAHAQEAAKDATTLDKVVVTAKRANRVSKGATGLPMEVKDTPQTISSIDQEDMANFGLTGSNEALGLATGINVEQYETNRATFNSRGFEIQLTQVDGLGMTNSWGTVVGREDTFLFERIELIRGANGLLTGVGNASGTINYIRKRPKNEDGGEVNVTAGSYGMKRLALDYNKVLTDDGSWAGRLVVAHEDKDSYLRDLHDKRTSVYGVVDGQIGTNGVLTLGFTAVDAKQDSPMWGSLTLLRSDGTQADFDVGSSTSQKWTYWNTKSYNAFAEYTHRLAQGWEAKVTYNYRRGDESTRLLYAYSLTGVLNPDNTGLVGWPYRSEGTSDNQVLDANVTGEFSAFGRQHSLLVGASQSRQKTSTDTYAAQTHMLDPLPAFPYADNVYAEPDWGPRQPSTRGEQTLTRLYAASRISLTDGLKGILGLNAVRLARSGASIYGSVATDSSYPDTCKVSPYAGLTYDFTPNILGYLSYSDIFQNQDQTDINGAYLAPMKGVNTEVGVKADWLNKSLLTTFALFTAKQDGLATYGGIISGGALDGQYWYEPKNVTSKGFEFEATGRIGKDTKVTVGYTRLILTGPDGNDIYEWVPRNTVNFRLDSRVPMLPALRLGVGGRWQSDVSKIGSASQEAYLVANAFASYEVTKAATLRLNVNNLFDKKYIGGLAYGAIYGAPRNVALTLDYKL
jgi:outer membrane receptor for ferric coprogen and ferric-rhodotorulic acid